MQKFAYLNAKIKEKQPHFVKKLKIIIKISTIDYLSYELLQGFALRLLAKQACLLFSLNLGLRIIYI